MKTPKAIELGRLNWARFNLKTPRPDKTRRIGLLT